SVHSGGLDHFDGREFTHIRPDGKDPDSLPELYVGSLVLDQNDSVWMGSATMGLLQWNPVSRKATAHLLDPDKPRSKVGNWVRDINSDGRNIWVASYSGLFRFDLTEKKFTRCYTEKDGMASSSVLSVQPDLHGNIWVSTMAGLSKLDVQNQAIRNYDVGNGLQSANFCERSRTRLPDGWIAFGGVNGFNLFDPDRLSVNSNAPPVVLTEFQLFNKPVAIGGRSPLKKAIHVTDQITLRHEQEVFRLSFAGMDFTAPQKNRYAYRLEGFDGEWRYTTANDRSATYTKLNPGRYVFRVKAANNDGVWNEEGASLVITILPRWWQTWWFRVTAVTALLALAYATFAIRIESIKRRNRRLESEVAERTADLNEKSRALQTANKELEAFSYSVSHDLRAPLRSIDGFSRILMEDYAEKLDAEGKENLRTIRAATQRMGDLIDDMLRLSMINRTDMKWAPVNLSAIVGEIARDLRKAEPHRRVEFVIAPDCIAKGDSSLLRIALQNMLSNAWKYTGKKPEAKIEFGFADNAGERVLFVRDNGCGFDMKQAGKLFNAFQRLHDSTEFPGTGIGLASVQRVIQRHGGRVWIDAEVDRGAVVYFSLPA
ncbi:MAG TPA: ATP-binding protein, partial [Candidatus Paceibacterota bacterium]|nr:ATP-binding protein [Candidatus Paceibacterota bacterium]